MGNPMMIMGGIVAMLALIVGVPFALQTGNLVNEEILVLRSGTNTLTGDWAVGGQSITGINALGSTGAVTHTGALTASGGGALTGTWTDLGSVTTVDINGGTLDGAIIGGAAAGAITGTTLNATGGGALTGTWTDLGSVTTVDINGGTADAVTIGGATPAAGTVTTLTVDNTTLNSETITTSSGDFSIQPAAGSEFNIDNTGANDVILSIDQSDNSGTSDSVLVLGGAGHADEWYMSADNTDDFFFLGHGASSGDNQWLQITSSVGGNTIGRASIQNTEATIVNANAFYGLTISQGQSVSFNAPSPHNAVSSQLKVNSATPGNTGSPSTVMMYTGIESNAPVPGVNLTLGTSSALLVSDISAPAGTIDEHAGIYFETLEHGTNNFELSAQANLRIATGGAERARVGDEGVLIGDASDAFPSTGDQVMIFGDGTAPSGMGSNTAGIYGNDVAGTVELFAIDEGGTTVQLSNHPAGVLDNSNLLCLMHPGAVSSSNPYIGKTVTIDWCAVILELEALSGKKLMTFADLPAKELRDWDTDQQAIYQGRENERAAAQAARDEVWAAYQAETDPATRSELLKKHNNIEIPATYKKVKPPKWMKDRGANSVLP